MYGVRVPVLHRQFAGDAGELESRAVRCREGEVATGLRFHGAENIGRAATLVLVIPPRFPPWYGWESGPNMGMRGHRFFVQTNYRFGWIVWSFIGLQHVLHLGDVLFIDFGHAPHFFPATA